MRLISGYHLLQQTAFVIELGLNAFLLVLAAYFHLRWDRLSLGIFLGLSVPACVHLATWAVSQRRLLGGNRTLFDFLNMATSYLGLLILLYSVIVLGKARTIVLGKARTGWALRGRH